MHNDIHKYIRVVHSRKKSVIDYYIINIKTGKLITFWAKEIENLKMEVNTTKCKNVQINRKEK